jgi:hypothetical protein
VNPLERPRFGYQLQSHEPASGREEAHQPPKPNNLVVRGPRWCSRALVTSAIIDAEFVVEEALELEPCTRPMSQSPR